MQGTRKPVLPVHTDAEKNLFHFLMQSSEEFCSKTRGPIWKPAVKLWNRYADANDDIFYKLEEQLKIYYTEWKVNLNSKETLSLTYNARKALATTLKHPARSTAVVPVPEKLPQIHTVSKGIRTLPTFFQTIPSANPLLLPIASSSQFTLEMIPPSSSSQGLMPNIDA
ncbi:hypothetical protein CPB84DRAFT_1908275, partial [Gymnopilus junonius]